MFTRRRDQGSAISTLTEVGEPQVLTDRLPMDHHPWGRGGALPCGWGVEQSLPSLPGISTDGKVHQPFTASKRHVPTRPRDSAPTQGHH